MANRFFLLLIAASPGLAGCVDHGSPTVPLEPQLTVTSATSLVVSNTNDDGPGSLRQAIADAPAGATIRFDPRIAGQTLAVAATLGIFKALTIEGPRQGISLSEDPSNSLPTTILSVVEASFFGT